MRTLHHPAHRTSLVLVLARPTLHYDLERVPRALLQSLVPQTLRDDPSAPLPRAEPGERAPPCVR